MNAMNAMIATWKRITAYVRSLRLECLTPDRFDRGPTREKAAS